MQFVNGNIRGEGFATTLAAGLEVEGIGATAVGGRDESRMEWRLQQGAAAGLTRSDPQFEVVIVVVGDKPDHPAMGIIPVSFEPIGSVEQRGGAAELLRSACSIGVRLPSAVCGRVFKFRREGFS
jgi:hypothetical protein